MWWLADRPMWLLVVVFVGGFTVVVLLGRELVHRMLSRSAESAAAVAPPLMPALGAAFAVLAAFAVANAASNLRDANADVQREATAAARLAWAAADAKAVGAPIQPDLQAYLDATLKDEWRDLERLSAGSGPAFDELTALQRSTRITASSDALGTPQRTELLNAIDEVAGARRARFAAAEPVAAGVVVLLVLSAIALLLNATVLTLTRERRSVAVLGTLVVVTGLSIATVITLGAPFSGSFGASARPLQGVANDLRSGKFELAP